MNRHAFAHGRRVFSIVATVLLLTTPDASGQFELPPAAATKAPTGSSSVVSGQQLIGNARIALARKDYQRAVQAYRQAAALSPTTPQITQEVTLLRKQLQSAGIDAALLELPPAVKPQSPSFAKTPPSMARLPGVAGAQPLAGPAGQSLAGPAAVPADPAARKRETLRLLAIGRAALDRGDAATALALAKQAESMNVPDQAFAPGEPRVWQLKLDAESASRRGGIALTAGAAAPVGTRPVQQAIATSNGSEVDKVAQMLFAARADQQGNGAVRQVQNEAAIPEVTDRKPTATEQFDKGMAALASGNKQAARTAFLEAWQQREQLDLDRLNQLKTKLTLLQPTRLGEAEAKSPVEKSEMTAIERAELAAQENTRRLYREVTAELAKAAETKESKPLDTLDDLERLRRTVDSAQISEDSRRTIAALVDRSISEQKRYNEANRAKIDNDLRNQSIRTEMATEKAREASIDKEVSQLVETFNELMKERRFEEARVVAKQVSALKPGDTVATQMFNLSQVAIHKQIGEQTRDEKEDTFLRQMQDIEDDAIYNPDNGYAFPSPEQWVPMSQNRLYTGNEDSRLSAAEQAIKKKLSMEVDVRYRNRPLGEVLDELEAATGVPIYTDTRALSSVRVTTDTPVSLNLPQPLALRSALNLMLQDLELTYVIENDVLYITSVEAKRSKVYPRTYRVTDLVTPIPNFTSSYEDGLAGALRAAYQMSAPQTDVHIMPVSMTDLGMAKTMQPSSMSPNVLGQYHGMGSQSGFGPNNPPMGGGAGGGAFADFQSLIDLIQTTVVPDTWEALGGPSTMAPYPQNLSLVISTTSDVHDQIADLLESLRALQNLQITIEVRFITLSDSFFEQIGVDFNVQFDDNVQSLPYDDEGPSVTVGLGGDGLPTADFDIRFDNGSFGATPPFGGFDAGAASTIGFAILSDIEAFFFLQAAQGDNRNNIMQAPKVTLFDGQIATINDVTQRPFVTSITPVVGDFAVAQQPVIVVLNEGTQLNVQGIVSDDKRFVRLTLVPFFSQIGNVDTFTYEGSRTTSSSSRDETDDTNGDGVVDDRDAVDTTANSDVIQGTTVQLPTFAFTQVSTTVSVPDGGTILLGGIKRLAEGRSERGVPMLSKIPYLSRLFRNVSVGRDARSLMLMVTPRIIIQEEEEEAQTGFNPRR